MSDIRVDALHSANRNPKTFFIWRPSRCFSGLSWRRYVSPEAALSSAERRRWWLCRRRLRATTSRAAARYSVRGFLVPRLLPQLGGISAFEPRKIRGLLNLPWWNRWRRRWLIDIYFFLPFLCGESSIEIWFVRSIWLGIFHGNGGWAVSVFEQLNWNMFSPIGGA